jgi:hypothetical protein
MHSDLVATIAFVCTFGGALLGMWLRTALPEHHVDDKSRNAINTGVGLIAAMSALVLGLITASAKSSYDSVDTAVRATAVDILTLDRALARYGPESGAVRANLKKVLERRVDAIWPPASGGPVRLDPQGSMTAAESLIDQIRDLKPQTRSQETLQPRALDLAESLLKGDQDDTAAISRDSPVVADAHVHKLWPVCTEQRHGDLGPVRLRAVHCQRLVPGARNGFAVSGLAQSFRTADALCAFASQSISIQASPLALEAAWRVAENARWSRCCVRRTATSASSGGRPGERQVALRAAVLTRSLYAFGAIRALIDPLAVLGLGRPALAAIRRCHAIRIFLRSRGRASVWVNLDSLLPIGANNFAVPVGNTVRRNSMCTTKQHQ